VSAVRSILAVAAGFVAVVVLSEGTDFVLRTAELFPPLERVDAYTTAMFVAATIYRTLAGAVGGFVAAILAPRAPVGHALALGAIGLALSTLGAVVMWGVGPAWYPLTLALLALPSAWLGGVLATRRPRAA
jgi:hypothetical protein